MVGTSNTEFVIMLWKLNPNVSKRHPHFERVYKERPVPSMTTMRDWYTKTLFEEKSKLLAHINVRYCEWRIQTSDKTVFKVFNVDFKKIMIIFGDETVHWLFYTDNSNFVEGSAKLAVTWCGCCLHTQYKSILKAVKKACMIQLQKNSKPCFQCDACRSRRNNANRQINANGGNNPINIGANNGAVVEDNDGVPHYVGIAQDYN